MENLCTRACRPLILFCLLLCLGQLIAQATVKTENYPDGKPKLYSERVDGRADGRWLEWYPDGELRYRARWKNGLGYGLWEYFYDNGRLRSETVYIDDQPTGVARAYHRNGQLATQTVYVLGRRHGEELTFNEVGVQIARSFWLEGQQIIDRPVKFAPETISTKAADEWDFIIAPTGTTAYFTRRPADRSETQRIYRSDLVEGSWSDPVPASFSTATDESPALSADGRWLYFASYRPIPGREMLTETDMNLWRTEWTNGEWSTPKPLPATINRVMQPGDEWPYAYEAGPSLDSLGNLYYWTGLTPGTNADLVSVDIGSNNKFGVPQRVEGLSADGTESGPAVSPDGQLLCFSAYNREDGLGQEDIYCARREDDNWGKALNLGPLVNGPGNEGRARFSPDGRYFYYSSDGETGEGWDIYYVGTDYLPFPR